MAIHDLLGPQSSTHGHLHAKSIRIDELWRYPKSPILKNIIPPQQNELQTIEPNPTKILISNFQYAACFHI